MESGEKEWIWIIFINEWKQIRRILVERSSPRKHQTCSNFTFKGKGKFTTSDGTTYDGTWIEDQFTGNGNKITFGTLNPSKYPQRNTEKSYLQGSTYLGGIENSLMFGNGVLSFFDNKGI